MNKTIPNTESLRQALVIAADDGVTSPVLTTDTYIRM